ncbi:factor associated with metabolism and energy [Ambystoma mexicanum]|uniref:factor associated with metabolism and energy n=1 Tax=Ambystoma mexicanum TaxID=8296 RepID=UPI0037E7F2DB
MGSNHSRATQKVTKVTPAQTQEHGASPFSSDTGFTGRLETRGAPSAESPWPRKTLPPLRETLHGRGPAVPGPIPFKSMAGNEEQSIIKKHPPRRLQKLEPIPLPSILTSEQTSKEMGNRWRAEKHNPGRRQHLHKMQMLEQNRKRQEMNQLQSQAELRRNLHLDAESTPQKTKRVKSKKVRGNVHRDGEDEFITQSDGTLNLEHGFFWNGDFSKQCETPEFYRSKNSKLEMWLLKHRAGNEIICDSSSSESLDDWKGNENGMPPRPPLMRTKTERIPTFDEFFDQDF